MKKLSDGTLTATYRNYRIIKDSRGDYQIFHPSHVYLESVKSLKAAKQVIDGYIEYSAWRTYGRNR